VVAQFISPLNDTLIRFDAAAALLARWEENATSDAMLEMLVRATWRGDFNPPCQFEDDHYDHSKRNDPDNWLHIPIEAPPAALSETQLNLKPRPFEYFEGSCETLLSVMYSMKLLPGDASAWDDLLKHGDGKMHLHSRHDALTALVRMPLNTYSEAGRDYLAGLFIPRAMLQTWLDRRSSRFNYLLGYEQSANQHPLAEPTNERNAPSAQVKRGRPRLAAWTKVASWAVQLNARFPDMPRKELAGKLYERALQDFGAADVPSESTILRRLAGILDDGA
tara:strand:- start:36514 stop:37347 length:834 start_codon:yes stop_codon:yes gene_type:complete